jgi:hypothetical protein
MSQKGQPPAFSIKPAHPSVNANFGIVQGTQSATSAQVNTISASQMNSSDGVVIRTSENAKSDFM